MNDTLQNLIDLQEVDRQLSEIESKKGSLPARVQNLEAEAKKIKAELELLQEKREENQKEILSIEGSLMDDQEKVKKYQDQLYLVTTNREYDALTNEIETVKNNILYSEERLSILQAENEENETLAKAYEEQIEDLDKQLITNRSELKEKSAQTDAKQVELEKRREELVSLIRPRYLRKYDRILKARRRAVVPIQRGACSGCHKQLSPQRLYEIRRMDSFMECENCGRILVYIPDPESVDTL